MNEESAIKPGPDNVRSKVATPAKLRTFGPKSGIQLALLRLSCFVLAPLGFRGVGTITKRVGALFSSSNYVICRLSESVQFKVDLADSYWSRLISPRFVYERDIARIVDMLFTANCAFVDCGANIGYWSVIVSDKLKDGGYVIAVEASRDTFEKLEENNALNGSRIHCLNAAISDVGGIKVPFMALDKHESSRVVGDIQPVESGAIYEIDTLSIDQIVKEYLRDFDGLIMVKIDIEGGEINAIKGASHTLANRECVLIYEEGGWDSESTVTSFVLNELGLDVFFLTEESAIRINNVEELAPLKTNIKKGYNCIAVKASLSLKVD